MVYAIRKDGQGWRAVNSQADVDAATEVFSTVRPSITYPTRPDVDGFVQAVKAVFGGIIAANAVLISYPAFLPAVHQQHWADLQTLIIDAKTTAVITLAQYDAIKTAAINFSIPITL